MADQFLLPATLRIPRLPADAPQEWTTWARQLQDVLLDQHANLANRVQNLITVGVIASRPAATGELRFYFSTDESPPKLYFDDGSWNAV